MDRELPIYRLDDGEKFAVTEKMKDDFNSDGFIIVRNLLTKEEIDKVQWSLEAPDSAVMSQSYEQSDGDGCRIRMVLWNHPGDDVTGMVNRCEKVVRTCEQLIGGAVYHYHSKLVLKEPRTGGAFQWHQDYGYWYSNGVLFPNMVSVQIGIDRMDTDNGCLRVIRGSHRMGRIEHGRVGDQAGADIERVNQATERLGSEYVRLDRGDALFFHCNVLHRSDQNRGERRRWALISCYNRADNDPVKRHHHASYTPLHVVPDSAIMECTNLNNIEGKWFVNPNTDNPGYLPKETGKIR